MSRCNDENDIPNLIFIFALLTINEKKVFSLYHLKNETMRINLCLLLFLVLLNISCNSKRAGKKEDVEKLAVGDQITLHEEGAAWNQFVTVAVESIEKNDQYHLVTINGGMEEQYGLDLKLEDDAYRTMTFDDYPVYYEMGEKTMPLAEDVVLKDSSADPQAEAVETTGADAVAAAINADPDNWTTYNTTLVVQGGKVLEVRRIWVP